MDESVGAIDAWIDRCRALAEKQSRPLYLEYVPELGEAPSVPQFLQAMVCRLAASPCDSVLRFAVLYPLLLRNWMHRPEFADEKDVKIFSYVAGLCVTEKLTNLADLKCELNYMYWAGNWDKAKELFQRIALLELLMPQEVFALRGHFWFLSVFGRQIRRELEGEVDGWIYEWPPTRPSGAVCPPGDLIGAVGSDRDDCFLRPELLARGSYAHLILLAWCTNPRPPRPVFEDLPTLLEEAPCERDANRDLPLDPSWEQYIRRYEHEKYRSFDPIKPPNLTEDQKLRLSAAVDDLKQVVDIGGALAVPYRPLLARALFAMGRFKEAAGVFERMIDDLNAERASREKDFSRKIKEGIEFDELCHAILGQSPDYDWEIYFSAAWSHRLAGDSETAIATCSDSLPVTPALAERAIGLADGMPKTETMRKQPLTSERSWTTDSRRASSGSLERSSHFPREQGSAKERQPFSKAWKRRTRHCAMRLQASLWSTGPASELSTPSLNHDGSMLNCKCTGTLLYPSCIQHI